MTPENDEIRLKIENGPTEESEVRLKRRRIGLYLFTALAATSFVIGVLALVVNVESHWRSRHFVRYSAENWLEISFANGRFYLRSRTQFQNVEDPFHLDNGLQIVISDPSHFVRNMERQKQTKPPSPEGEGFEIRLKPS